MGTTLRKGDHGGSLVEEKPGGNAVQAFNDKALRVYPLLTPTIDVIVGVWVTAI